MDERALVAIRLVWVFMDVHLFFTLALFEFFFGDLVSGEACLLG